MILATIFSNLIYSKLEQYKIDLERDLKASDFIPDYQNKISKFYGTTGTDAEAILIGDSHAIHYSEAIIQWAQEKGISLEIVARGSCQLIGGIDMQIKEHSKCAKYIQRIQERLLSETPLQYFIVAQRFDALVQGGDPESLSEDTRLNRIDRNLPKVIEALDYDFNILKENNAYAQFIILGQVPRLENDPRRCEQRMYLWATSFFNVGGNCVSYTLDYFTNQKILGSVNAVLKNFSLNRKHAHLYSPDKAFPINQVKEWGAMYLDDDHLSKEGSLHAGKFFDF
tara:strand:- start:21 stop:869 length:849 start_codon:yes stop_codon:yes gene_type:complete